MSSSRKVALITNLRAEWFRDFVMGVGDFIHMNRPWNVHLHRGLPCLPWEELSHWEGDGVIALGQTEKQCQMLLDKHIPVVNISAALEAYPFPSITSDNTAIGRLAAEHFLETGLHTFAFYGPPAAALSRRRREGFAARLKTAGYACDFCPSHRLVDDLSDAESPAGDRAAAALLAFLTSARKPVGLLAANDRFGCEIIAACGRLGLRIPEDVAVIGVDNEAMICDFADPSLTSISQDGRQIGTVAARTLDALMNGGNAAPPPHIEIPPLGLMRRRSSDLLTAINEHVAEALRFIRNNAARNFDVSDILARLPISRRSLEIQFKRIVGRTLHEEIRRVHVEHAKRLLTTTSLSISQVAIQAGYHSPARFDFAFRRENGTSPGLYRRQQSAGG